MPAYGEDKQTRDKIQISCDAEMARYRCNSIELTANSSIISILASLAFIYFDVISFFSKTRENGCLGA